VLSKQIEELKRYDEVIHNCEDQQIEIDLNDFRVALETYPQWGVSEC